MFMPKQFHPRPLLREWRLYRERSQAETADHIGVTQGHYSSMENGRKPCTITQLYALAAFFDCEPADLIDTDPTKPDRRRKVWDEIPPDAVEQALKILETFKRSGKP
jgi:transcriptional regulator with XRE-family HTH domain